ADKTPAGVWTRILFPFMIDDDIEFQIMRDGSFDFCRIIDLGFAPHREPFFSNVNSLLLFEEA
ncbi:MAG: hypothetical protein ACP5I1_19805, partial [Candidatus Hinthialibacter sp.]